MCSLFTQHMQSSRIISTSLSVHDEKEATEAIIGEGKWWCHQIEEHCKGSHASQ